ncbi:hypothetical protein IV102_38550, partial [bacterium]|nr:hypothetical protein [bacterium]
MTADIRLALENEMDHMDESMVESWVQRCYESCDPRYDTDWLMGMFELALMQFPDNYEIRAAASKASTMEAQRLYDEGDTQEAVSRLERLLESDPYCTDAFEMLERFMQGSATDTATEAPEAVPPVVLEPAPVQIPPVVEISPLPESHDDDLLSFLDDNLMIDGLHEPVPVPDVEAPSISLAPPVEPVGVAPPIEALAPPPPLEAPPAFLESAPVALAP